MMTFEKVLEVFNDYLNKDSVLEVVNTKRGYTVMIWDEKDEQWFGVEHCLCRCRTFFSWLGLRKQR